MTTAARNPALEAMHNGAESFISAHVNHSNPAVKAFMAALMAPDLPSLSFGKEQLSQNVPNLSTPGAGITLS